MTEIAQLREWVGKCESLDDLAAPAPPRALAALLDHDTPPWAEDEVPPLGHWLYFLPRAKQSEMDIDGHPKRGGFLPPVDLPRRMFAGGSVTIHAPIAIGASIRRDGTILDVTEKQGASGRLVFVKVRYEVFSGDTLAVTEEQDIVFREGETVPVIAAKPINPRLAGKTRRIEPDATMLFRFSALTFNAHRIHYDRDYACEEEYYPGLVVQGPLIAILLLDHLLRQKPALPLRTFSFRARSPLFDTAPFELCLAAREGGYDLWALDSIGREAMTAEVAVAT
ncbi:MAG TPA: MaoC family dehydratase N-terminal domain-containing protein [Rhizomicrobium sp.]|nr:MaoC family dehydratase N-terminal domain-containing protein [Rhizomicrobium sp.]